MTEISENKSNWRIDKQIPIAVIFAMLIQTGAIIWWAGKLDSRVQALEANDLEYSVLIDRVTRVEEKVTSLKETTQQMNDKLETIITRKR